MDGRDSAPPAQAGTPAVLLCHGAHTSPSVKSMLPSLRNGAGVFSTFLPSPLYREADLLMRRTILLLATMALTLLVASGVALAVTKIGTNGPDILRGTNRADN